MTDTSEDHEGTVNIGGRTITNLRFADDIDGLAGEEKELANLVERLDKASRIAQTRAALTRLKPVWIDKSISLSSKIRLMRSRVTSICLYACETWTLTAELQRRIQAMEMRCYRKILHISYKDHVTNEEVRAKIQQAIGPHEDLTIVGRRKLQTAVV